MVRRIFFLLVCLTWLVPSISLAKVNVLAIVNDREITEDDLAYELDIEHRREGDRAPEFNLRRFLERIIDDTLIIEEALQMGLHTGPWVQEKVREYMINESVKKLYNEEILEKIKISDTELREYFRRNYETYELMIIETTSEERIREAWKDLSGGLSFEEVMERYSDVKRKKDNCTVKYYFKTLEQSKEFFDNILKLKPGETSSPFRASDRFYIVRLISRIVPGDDEFEKKKDSVVKELKRKKEEELSKKYLEKLRKKIKIWKDEALIKSLRDKESLKDLKEDRRVIAKVGEDELYLNSLITPERDIKGADLEKMVEGWIDRKVVDIEALSRKYHEKSPLKEQVMRYRDQLVKRVFIGTILIPKIKVDDEILRSYYEENKERYRYPDQVRLQKIVVKTKAEAESILEKLKKGADFGWLARQFSVDESSKKGGDIGWYELSALPANERKEIEGLLQGGLSNVIEEAGRYVIIKVLEKRQGEYREFGKIYEIVKNDYMNNELKKLIKGYVELLRKDARIVYNEDNISSLEKRFRKKDKYDKYE